MSAARANGFDVILSDMRMPGISGLDVLQQLRDQHVDSAFIVMTGFGTIDTAVEAMKLGAVDFVQKPFLRDELLMRVKSAAERRQLARQVELLQRQIKSNAPLDLLIGDSEPMTQGQGADRPRRDRQWHGADHRGDRHRQGAGRARRARRKFARRENLRRPELRGADGLAARERVVRACPRGVHRRRHRARRADRARQWRHAVPRRDRDHVERGAGEAPARARGRRSAPRRRERVADGGRQVRGRRRTPTFRQPWRLDCSGATSTTA